MITTRKPLKQTTAMKEVLASLTALIRHLLVAGHDTVADSTFSLALERTGDIAAEGEEAVGYAAVLVGDVSLFPI